MEAQPRPGDAEPGARLRRCSAQLEAAQRELQSFCNCVAHDLRGPLAAIDGFSCLLDELLQGAADARARHYLERIRTGVRQMDQRTEALLRLAQLTMQEERRDWVDLSALARTTLARRAQQEQRPGMLVEVQPDLRVQADALLVPQLVEQLLDNAWKFTARVPWPRIAIGRAPREAGGAYYVRDNGPGFDMAYADKLFKPFHRLHAPSEFPGLGIGLAMVERIVARHGGHVWAEAVPQEGATFWFTLP